MKYVSLLLVFSSVSLFPMEHDFNNQNSQKKKKNSDMVMPKVLTDSKQYCERGNVPLHRNTANPVGLKNFDKGASHGFVKTHRNASFVEDYEMFDDDAMYEICYGKEPETILSLLKTRKSVYCHPVREKESVRLLSSKQAIGSESWYQQIKRQLGNLVSSNALIQAIKEGNKEAVEKNCSSWTLSIPDKYGDTPLWWAATEGRVEIMKILKNKGIDLDRRLNRGSSALIVALALGHNELVTYLIGQGVNINLCDKSGWSPLLSAVYNTNKKGALLLLNKGAQPNVNFHFRKPILHWAAIWGDCEVGKLLIKKWADFEVVDEDGQTALNEAVSRKNYPFAKLLVENGADCSKKNKLGLSPFFQVLKNGNFKNGNFLEAKFFGSHLAKKMSISLLNLAIDADEKDFVSFLLKDGSNPYERAKDGRTLWEKAAEEGKSDMIKIITQHQIDKLKAEKDSCCSICFVADSNNPEDQFVLCDYKCLNVICAGCKSDIKRKSNICPICRSKMC